MSDIADADENATVRSGYGHAKFFGDRVEEAVCGDPQVRDEPLYPGLYLDRSRTFDARRAHDKAKVQIKGCRIWTSNGPNQRRRGRFRIWWDQLQECAEFVFVVYDPRERYPIEHHCRMRTDDLRLLLPTNSDEWYESGHTTKRGTDRFRWLVWTDIFGDDE